MIQRAFLHWRLTQLEEVLESSSLTLQAYDDRALDLPNRTAQFLTETAERYARLGWTESRNATLALQAELRAATSGTDPITLEHVTTGRRRLQSAVALRALLRSAEQLRNEAGETRRQIRDVRELLLPLVLVGLQRHPIEVNPDGSVTQDALQDFWHKLGQDPEFHTPAQQVAANAAPADILLLIADILTAIAAPDRDRFPTRSEHPR